MNRRIPTALASAVLLTGCGRLDELTTEPAVTPAQWCADRPCILVGGTVLSEPWSSLLVTLLALLWLASGIYFVATADRQRSRQWLGVALVLGGIGAALAGVSYQAFSYVLKCEGLDTCRLTTWWEVGYSVAQAMSVSAMVVAVAFACTTGRTRRAITWYAALNVVVYLIVTGLGAGLPSRAALSFEVLMLFAVPGIVLVIVLAARGYLRAKDDLARSLLIAAGLLVVVQIAYFIYYTAGATAALWQRGIYFSQNDVLHVGMIGWLAYVVLVVGRHLRDCESADRP